ncbi:MAG: exo-alpha-sialidase [Candidatus Nealsonbacteria bacterium]|nr:exo-alpha-sialidase [Candidatus Nealsonbacteria bacterium]
MRKLPSALIPLCLSVTCILCMEATAADPRNLRNGHVIPDEGYCDQPYTVVTADGNWLCTLTTGPGKEGNRGQHVAATISSDRGRTWSKLIDIEPTDGPEASWAMPLVVPGGRVYVFYVYNGEDVRTWQGRPIRADTLGWYVYKFSDDHGRTWSKDRYRLPMRQSAVDRTNTFGGKWQIFWGIGKPIVAGDAAVFAFARCGKHLIDNSEGWFFRSGNVLHETDPAKIRWQLLPDGDVGLKSPEFGAVQAEQNVVALRPSQPAALPDSSLYCMYRTVTGYPCHSYSRDGGRTWTKPEHATYTPGGRKMKNPRACPRIWRAGNGKFLFWFHNHSGKDYRHRNPAWIAGGVQRDDKIHWSQPEILLYDPDLNVGPSYPDLIEQDGRYWITETQKTVARVHEIDPTLLEGLWRQGTVKKMTTRGLAATFQAGDTTTVEIAMPALSDLSEGGGFSIDFRIALADLTAGQEIFSSRDDSGKGIALTTAEGGAVRIELSDGKQTAGWNCDAGLLRPNTSHHVAVIVDGGPKIITFVVDGRLCDGGTASLAAGGTARQYGWGRFPKELGNVNGAKTARIMPSSKGNPGLRHLRIYDRYLRTSEAVANWRIGDTG